MWVCYTLFQPVLHLTEKTIEGTRVRRRWDAAATPLARLRATDALDPTERQRLDALYPATTPRALRRTILEGLGTLRYPRPTVVAPDRAATPATLDVSAAG